MAIFLGVLVGLLGYVVVATALTPFTYRRLRGKVKNSYSYAPENSTARNFAYIYAWLWPIGLFLLFARSAMHRVDERADLDKKERAELDRFRAEAMKELS